MASSSSSSSSSTHKHKKNLHVLIVGGGVSGPALCLALAKLGIKYSIFEAYPSYNDQVGAGMNLAPNGLNALEVLGLADKIKESGCITKFAYMKDENGSVLGKLSFGDPDTYGQYSVSLTRALLYRTVNQALNDLPDGSKVQYGKRLSNIEETEDNITITFEDGTTATGDILIGADGVRSAVRKHLLPDGPDPEFVGVVGVGGFLDLDKIPPACQADIDSMTFTFGPQGFFGWCGVDNGQVMWWSNVQRDQPYTYDELVNPDWEQIKQELANDYGKWHDPIPQCIQNTNAVIRQNIFDVRKLPFWHRGRICMIGDAAHAVSPNAGQGASIALEDALYLAKMLHEHEGDYAKAFVQFETERKPRCEMIVKKGRQSKAKVSWLTSKIRATMMWLFLKVAPNPFHEAWIYKVDLGLSDEQKKIGSVTETKPDEEVKEVEKDTKSPRKKKKKKSKITDEENDQVKEKE